MLTEQPDGVSTTQNPAGSEKRLANLKPFQRGSSGNPGGRPKTNPIVKALALKNSKRAMERIIELIEDEDARVALMAAKEVLDRAYGKVRPSDDDDGDKKSVTINIVRYGDRSPQQLESETISVRALAVS